MQKFVTHLLDLTTGCSLLQNVSIMAKTQPLFNEEVSITSEEILEELKKLH